MNLVPRQKNHTKNTVIAEYHTNTVLLLLRIIIL